MRYIAAYLLLQSGGNSSPSAGDIKKVLSSVDIDVDDSRLEKLLSELDGKSIDQLIAEGSSKLASVPSGGGAPAGASASSSAPAATSAPAAQVEEKKEEEKEESDDDMGFGLFD